jgi:hypothetical protein
LFCFVFDFLCTGTASFLKSDSDFPSPFCPFDQAVEKKGDPKLNDQLKKKNKNKTTVSSLVGKKDTLITNLITWRVNGQDLSDCY